MLNFVKKSILYVNITLSQKKFVSKLNSKQTTGFYFSQLLCTLKITPTVIIVLLYTQRVTKTTVLQFVLIIRIKLSIFDQRITMGFMK